MNGVSEGIGTAIAGGSLGHAAAPATNEAAPHTAGAPIACPNCGTSFRGHFCPNCGQSAHLHRTLSAIGHDLMHAVLHLDGKLSETLPLLALKPGTLTRRYIAGERAKFVSPMAMFLFSVFAMFAVFQLVGIGAPSDFGEGFVEGATGTSVVRTNIEKQITALEQERDRLPDKSPRRADIASELKGLEQVLEKSAPTLEIGESSARLTADTGVAVLDKVIAKWQKNPSLMLYKLQSNGYKFSWLLIPLSLPFLWLVFAWRREFKAYDHAVFITYSLAFMSLLFIAMSILSTIPGGSDWAALLFFFGAPLHLYKQLRHAYGLTRWSAVWRWFVLLFCIQIVLALFLVILGVLGAS